MATPAMYGQEVIVPSVDELKIETGSVCHFEGCGEVFGSSSQLHMHLVKHHRRKPLLLRSGSTLYCCPVSGCERSRGGKGKPFPRLGQLKQHYQRVHGEKKHSCDKCGKQFSLRDVFSRHVAECGQDISCGTCGMKFLTRNALYKHARRKNHTQLPSKSSTDKDKQVAKTGPMAASLSLPHIQIVVKQVVKLSKQVSVATQTEEEMVVGAECPHGVSCYEEQVHTSESSDICGKRGGNTIPSLSIQPSSSLDFSTQTEDMYPGNLQSSFDLNDLATQTDFSELLGFGTKCASSQTHLVCSDNGLGEYLSSSPPSGNDSILKEAIMNSLGESATSLRSSDSLLNLECVGTQTTHSSMGCYEGLGTATQTSPEDFFCPLDEDSRIDFGTQTIDWLSDIATSVDL